jgi:tRNA pseudouridine38-40 synthase
MRRAAAFLAGRHDFSAFAAAGGSHGQPFRRIFSAIWEEAGGEELRFRVTGDGFLRGMVRALVGTLIEVGLGKRSPEAFAELLSGRPRSAAGPTAPAHGLVLERVFYPPPWRVQGDPELPVLI